MKSLRNVALGLFALGASLFASVPQASAGNFSGLIGQNAQTWVYHLSIACQLWTGSRVTKLLTTSSPANNQHVAWDYINCTGQPFTAQGGTYYGGNSTLRVTYYCPGSSVLTNSQQAYVNDT